MKQNIQLPFQANAASQNASNNAAPEIPPGQVIRDFIMSNLDKPESIFDYAMSLTLTNALLAQALENVTTEQVENFWETNGFNSSELDDDSGDDDDSDDDFEDDDDSDDDSEDDDNSDDDSEDDDDSDDDSEDDDDSDDDSEDDDDSDDDSENLADGQPGNGPVNGFINSPLNLDEDTANFLSDIGLSPGNIISFIAQNLGSPATIFEASRENGLSDSMLADILDDDDMFEGITEETISSFWQENGLEKTESTSEEIEIVGVQNDDTSSNSLDGI
ncbi:hypothetical protein [Thiomicrospira sp. WB1]|uniref:hypothetical protein n=1 Tax=Thiomicrospira sp. WB1 TaxID=1685380 RepID=UPI000A7C9320|nr:hypothetical protein [Thiomicrospira sp. WB1]